MPTKKKKVIGLLQTGRNIIRFFQKHNISLNAKFLVLLAFFYILFPFDAVPDFLPILGWIEDLVVGLITVGYVNNRVGEEDEPEIEKEKAITVQAKVIKEEPE